jgi:FKBP-type peptidyl-prolyl cis-trans isomerase
MMLLWQGPTNAVAADSPEQPAEFRNVGTQAPPPDGDMPFITLDNGVKVKDFRVGTGDAVVGPSSRVDIQCSGRLLNLNGVIFYNTKNNNPDGFGAIPLSLELGKGQAVPGLESGLLGMKKGGIRRIIVPQELAYNKFPDLEPRPMTINDQRALDSVVKNPRRDGAILFDVQLERFK